MASKRKPKTPTYWQAVRKIAQANNIPVKTVRRDFKGQTAEAKRIAGKKRITTSYKAYKRRIKIDELEIELRTNRERAEIYYETIEKIGKDRVERVVWNKKRPPKKLIKEYGKEALEEFSREIKRGKDKGKMVFYRDTAFDLPLNEQAAFLLRSENRVARITNDLLQYPWNKYRSFWGYFTDEQRKEISKRSPKTPTFKEAKEAAEVIDEALSDQEVFDLYIEVFGHSP
jgi:hypothetical protein